MRCRDAEEFFNITVKTYGPDICGFGSLFEGICRQRATCVECKRCVETDQDSATRCAPLLSLGSDIRPTIDQSLQMNYPESRVIRKICEFGRSYGDRRECGHIQTMERVSLPDVLVVHVLRFDQDGRKILPNGNDMEAPPFLEVGGRTYGLCSVVEHAGDSSRSGHYIAHVRCADTNSWHIMDDSRVNESIAFKAGMRPYVAFSQRQGRISPIPSGSKMGVCMVLLLGSTRSPLFGTERGVRTTPDFTHLGRDGHPAPFFFPAHLIV